jgi:hypothetical protein
VATGLFVGRVRLHVAEDDLAGEVPRARGRAEGLLRPLTPSSTDRALLIVRQLTIPAADCSSIPSRMAEVRRRAARPALGPVDPAATAVLFSDEAEALTCLTQDLADGTARRRWYWRWTLPARAPAPGQALTLLFRERARWLPAVLAALEGRASGGSVRVLAMLPPGGAEAVLQALLTAYQSPTRPMGPEGVLGRPGAGRSPLPGRPATALRAHGRRMPHGADRSGTPGRPTTSVQAERWRRWLPDGSASLAPPARALLGAALVLAAEPAVADALSFRRWLESLLAEQHDPPPVHDLATVALGMPSDPAGPPAPPAAAPGARQPDGAATRIAEPEPGEPVGMAAAGGRPGPVRTPSARSDRQEHSWAHWGLVTGTRYASALYVVNLLTTPGLLGPEVCASGWGTVEALARLVLRGTGDPRVRARDPLWAVLAVLDRREPGTRTSVRLGPAQARVRRLLDRHRLGAEVFTRPGRLVVSRTHVDVILGLDQIDLSARASGFDQDPGWVPALTRIVAFHFEDRTP